MKIKNIKIKDYLKLQYRFKYDIVEKYVKPKNLFNGKECKFNDLTFDEVTLIKKIVSKPTYEKIPILFEICYNENNFVNCKIIDYFQARKWIDKKVIELIELQNKMIVSIPDPKLIAAGVNNLERFAEENTKIDLGEQFSVPPFEIGTWKHTLVLLYQSRNSILNQVHKNLSEMK